VTSVTVDVEAVRWLSSSGDQSGTAAIARRKWRT
jgi:hypothetical protein